MERDQVLRALEAEAGQVTAVMLGVAEEDFDRPTRCRPWSVRELLAHLFVAGNRLSGMLAEPEPAEATVSAAGYYRADRRFGRDANEARVTAAVRDAASFPSGFELARALDEALDEMLALAFASPYDRLVRTRWDDAMTLGTSW